MKAVKNIIITHLIALVFFGGAAAVFAQEEASSTSPTPTDRQESLQERREAAQAEIAERQSEAEARRASSTANREAVAEKREVMQEQREERRTILEDKAKNRIRNLAANISNRIEAVLERLTIISERIESRIEKLQARGIDTTEAETALASAQVSIDAAYDAMEDIDIVVADAINAEEVRIAWVGVREIFQTVRDHIITARTELRNTVVALKASIEQPAPVEEAPEETNNDTSTSTSN